MKEATLALLLLFSVLHAADAGLPLEWRQICASYDRSSGSANRTGTCPVPHRSRAALLVDSRSVRVFGGAAGRVPRGDMWAYSVLEGRWSQPVADWRETGANWSALSCRADSSNGLPLPRYAASLFPDTSQLLFVGPGLCREPPAWAETDVVSVADYWFYAQSTGRWARAPTRSPPPVKDGASVVWNRKIFTFGGQSTNYPYDYTNIVFEMDLVRSSPSSLLSSSPRVVQTTGIAMPSARAMHSAVLTGNSMLVFGGRNASSTFGDAWTLDLVTYAWHQLTPFAGADAPCARSGHAAALCATAAPDKSDLLLVHGGENEGGTLLDDTYAYSTGQNAWFKIRATQPPQARRDATMHCSREGQAWLFGGEGASGFYNDLYTLL